MFGNDEYLPSWLKAGMWTNEQLDAMVKECIYALVLNNDNNTKVSIWCVLNELINYSDGSYRTMLLNQLGWEADQSGLTGDDSINAQHPVFIRKVLGYFREKTSAKLEIRDSPILNNNVGYTANKKHKALYQLIKHLKAVGAPVDAVSEQAHLNLGKVTTTFSEAFMPNNELARNVRKFNGIGVEVYISELDIGTGYGAIKWTEAENIQQRQDYRDVVVSAINAGIPKIAIWGIKDLYDKFWRLWQFQLLLDKDGLYKNAYYGVQDALMMSQSGTRLVPGQIATYGGYSGDYAEARSAGSYVVYNGQVAHTYYNNLYSIERTILAFPTPILPPETTITSLILRMTVESITGTFTCNIEICEHSDVTIQSNQEAYAESKAAAVKAIWSNTDDVVLNEAKDSPTLNADHLKQGGLTCYSIRSSRDHYARPPTHVEAFVIGSAELIITYATREVRQNEGRQNTDLWQVQIDPYAREYTGEHITHLGNAVYLRLATMRGSYWADPTLGSRLHLLQRMKDLPRMSVLAKQYAQEALQPLLADGRAETIGIDVEQPHNERLLLSVRITQSGRVQQTFQYWIMVL
jgi:phage gp46-like protein/GH35 family endo-1,4-beta-xylanase